MHAVKSKGRNYLICILWVATFFMFSGRREKFKENYKSDSAGHHFCISVCLYDQPQLKCVLLAVWFQPTARIP